LPCWSPALLLCQPASAGATLPGWSGLAPTLPGSGPQTPQGEVATFPPRLDPESSSLPWARLPIAPLTPTQVKHSLPLIVRLAAAAACSRAVSVGSPLPGPRPATVPLLASKRLASGGAGGLPSVTATATTANSAVVTKVNATGNAGSTTPRLPQDHRCLTRASAQPADLNILLAAPATAPAATTSSAATRVVRSSVSVRAAAARPYGESANASAGTKSGAARPPAVAGSHRDHHP
jgi:hypothetical protein